jgi:hypothetical protein
MMDICTSRLYLPNDCISIKHRSYKLPEPDPPANSLLDYIADQDQAYQRLLTGLELVHKDAVYWISQQWRYAGLLLSATNGSAPEDGTFGWVLALPDGTTLVECHGRADGAPSAGVL